MALIANWTVLQYSDDGLVCRQPSSAQILKMERRPHFA